MVERFTAGLGTQESLATSYWNLATADASAHLSEVVITALVIHAHDLTYRVVTEVLVTAGAQRLEDP